MEHAAEVPVGVSGQLEVCQLLHLDGVVIYPGGLNGGLEPVQVTLPKLPLRQGPPVRTLNCRQLFPEPPRETPQK